MSTNPIQLCSKVVQVKGNIVSDMAGEKVMLSVANGKYYNLGKIGGDIWELIQNPVGVSDLVDQLMQQYEVDRDLCEKQTLSFLSSLLEERLIEVEERS